MLFAGPIATYVIATTLMASEKPLERSLNELGCMVEVIHFEAQGESQEGKRGVANVILNRVSSKRFPNTVCEVVHQKYQFSYRNSLKIPTVVMKNQTDVISFRETVKVALSAVQGNLKKNTKGSNHYLNPNKIQQLPSWFNHDKVTKKIGNHVFLKLN